jgi:hypothetical protein
MRLFGYERWRWWSKSTFTAASEESFGIVPCIESKDEIRKEDLRKMKPGYQYIAQRTFSMPPILPVQTMEERRLFKSAITQCVGHNGLGPAKSAAKFDWGLFCTGWNEGTLDVGGGRRSAKPAPGNNIFKKQPYALESYYDKVRSLQFLL